MQLCLEPQIGISDRDGSEGLDQPVNALVAVEPAYEKNAEGAGEGRLAQSQRRDAGGSALLGRL